MPLLTPRQLAVLVALTLVWGLNWPVMKAGVSGLPAAPSSFPPLTFRAASMGLGLPVLGLALLLLKVPFAVPRRHWREMALFGFAHAAWFHLARTLPPVAPSISVMLIPVLGVFSGALLLGETVHGTDGAAVALIVLAIALVLLKR